MPPSSAGHRDGSLSFEPTGSAALTWEVSDSKTVVFAVTQLLSRTHYSWKSWQLFAQRSGFLPAKPVPLSVERPRWVSATTDHRSRLLWVGLPPVLSCACGSAHSFSPGLCWSRPQRQPLGCLSPYHWCPALEIWSHRHVLVVSAGSKTMSTRKGMSFLSKRKHNHLTQLVNTFWSL